MESHLQSAMKPHLDLACAKVKDTEEKLETRIFVWKITNFSIILSLAKAGRYLCSDSVPFDTARTESCGYKLRVRVYPNGSGSGKNTHLSVYIYVMKGEYDAILPWPFKKKVKFTLIDQQANPVERVNVYMRLSPGNYPESFAGRPKEEHGTGRGFSKFITHEEIHSRRYVVDDTLFLQVEVGPSSI